jgi:hypothetical protein
LIDLLFILLMGYLVLNGLACIFSLNLVIKQKKYYFIVHALIFFSIFLFIIYWYLRDYLLESVITFFILGGLPVILDDSLPQMIKQKTNLMTIFLVNNLLMMGLFYLFLRPY